VRGYAGRSEAEVHRTGEAKIQPHVICSCRNRAETAAKPSDLPVEQGSKFKLAGNLKTAKALGITMPEAIRLRADEVIR
jgi:putative ABC transport system substrate-binding protein